MKYLRVCYLIILSLLISSSISAEDNKVNNDNTKFNIYSGMFDFSDSGKKSTLIGFQHQNTDLNRDTFLGNLSPITGFMFTDDSAAYLYTGIQAQYSLGALNITPSFTPGLYIIKETEKIWDIYWNLKAKFRLLSIYYKIAN